jgi:ribosomal protein L22
MSIAGAGSNFMKLASIVEAVKKNNQQRKNKSSKNCVYVQHIVVKGNIMIKRCSFRSFKS